jgi:APA family basic amino acid/polyamine antiporter
MVGTTQEIETRTGPRSLARPGGRKLGLWMATALVVGNMIGSGVFLLPSSLAQYGGISIVAWGVTALGAMALAIVFARLGRAFPRTGGPYAYSRRAFGDFVGFQTAWGYRIAVWAGNAAIAVAFVGYLSRFWGELDGNHARAAVVATGAIWLLTWVNALGVRMGGWVQGVTTVLKLVPLVAIATIGLLSFDPDNFGAFNAAGGSWFTNVTAAATLTLWAFIGLESATVPAEDVADPERTIPRSTVIGTAVAAVVYILGTVAVMGVLSSGALAGSSAPFADAAENMWGAWAGDAVAVGAVISAFGALNGWILLQGQVPMAAARDRLFPAAFGRTTRSGAPVFGLVVSSVLVTVLMAMNYTKSLVDQFTFVILLATLTTLVPYALSAAAEVMLMITDRAAFSARRLAVDATVAGLAFAYSLWTIAGSGYQVVFRGFMLLMAGVPVYVFMKWRGHRAEPAAEAATAADLATTPSDGEQPLGLTA